MNIVKAHARTVRYFSYENNSDKFYRAISFGNYTVFQWGRVGSAIGQYTQVTPWQSEADAAAAASKKIDEKTGPRAKDRYGDEVEVYFDVDLDRIKTDKHSAQQVITVFDAADRTTVPVAGTPSTDGNQSVIGGDRLTLFTQRALDVVELAVGQPTEALAAFIDLNESWEALKEEVAKAEGYLKTADAMVSMT
jgi:predicted DNA-binding WGR domain protein